MTTLVSVSSDGTQGNGNSTLSAAGGASTAGGVSADGRFAVFESTSTNLVPNDLNGRKDVFVRNVHLGTTILASANVLGLPGNGDSTWPSLSDDGRFIAFASEASDLVAGDANSTTDVFVRDRVAGTTTLASVGLSGTSGNGRSRNPRISSNGRYVVFDSAASNLVPGDTTNIPNIFVRDLVAGTTRRASAAPDGSQANRNNILPYISPDGRFVTFASSATNLGIDLGGVDPTRHQQVYLRDLQTGALELISVTTSGKGATGGNLAGPISADGRFVVFISGGGDVLPGTCCGSLYLRDRVAQSSSRINGGGGPFPHMSPDARFVIFGSVSALRPEDTNVNFDVYLLDRSDGSLALVSLTPAGGAGAGDSFPAAITPDGRFAAFYSSAADLVPNDANGLQDVFLRDFGARGDFGTAHPESFGMPQMNSAMSPDPVNLATGVFTTRAGDLDLPGRVLNFSFTRWYNSADLTSGPLGPGWTHSFNWSLRDSGGGVEIRRGDGRRESFVRNGDGSYSDPPGVFDTLAKNSDGSFTLTLPNQVRYEFSTSGQLTRIHEPAGNQLTLGYASGNLATITDTVGRLITLSYDASARLVALQDPLARRVTYGFDGGGRLASVTDKLGNAPGEDPARHRWIYGYDGTTSHLVSITDPDGRVRVSNSYDAQGRVVQQSDGLGAVTGMSYGSGQSVLTDARGHPTTYVFDSQLRLVSQTDVVGSGTYTISYTYDAAGNIASVTDRRGSRTDFTYDPRGNLLSKTDPSPDGAAPRPLTRFAYDTRNNLVQTINASGLVTTMAYDPTTNAVLSLERQVDATTSATTRYTYDDPANPGLPTRITSPRGNLGPTPDPAFSTLLIYDPQANLVRRNDADGAVTTYAYDGAGRMLSFVDPDGNALGAVPADHTWRTSADAGDREVARTDPLGNIMRFTYDGAGNRTSSTDRNANTTGYAYDLNGRLVSVTQRPDPAGSPALTYSTRVVRDASGNATRVIQANGVVTDYAFDALNRFVSASTHPTSSTTLMTSYSLDGNGKPTSRTTGDGVTVNYAYDALSRLVSVAAPALAISYAYDVMDQRTRMTDATGTTTYAYDGLGRTKQVVAPAGSLTFAYDLDSNRTRLVYPNGDALTYSYSPGGRLSSVTDWAGRGSQYTYQPSGLVATVTYPNSLLASHTYDRVQRLTGLTYTLDQVIGSERYTLDPHGNPVALTDLFGTTPAVAGTLRYDGTQRLTAFERHFISGGQSIANETFGFDAASNVTARTGPSATFSYDAANRLTSDGARNFVWSAADQLVQRGADTFSYDALGRMTAATVGGTTRTYAYDGDGLLRTRSQGATTTSFLYDPALATTPLLQAGSERIVHGLAPLYRVHANGKFDAFVRDGLGSIRLEVSGSGKLTSAFDYTAYGALNGSPPMPLLGFTGELHDPSGLIYLRARWYDPSVGRLTTIDPMSGSAGTPASLNRYGYAAASPTVNTDPSGYCTGGGDVIYCIERWIPSALECNPMRVCGTGDDRWWPLPYGGTYKFRALIKSNGTPDFDVGYTTIHWGPFAVGPSKGRTSDCAGSAQGDGAAISCTAINGVADWLAVGRAAPPPIKTKVDITIVGGKPVVRASGTFFPSLAVYRYGADGPHLLYFYDGKAAGMKGLESEGDLPNLVTGMTEGK
jgi:RHS repeat-associated protein